MEKHKYKFVSLLIALVLLLSLTPSSLAATFRDVPKTNSFYDEVNYLVQKGIITGFADGTFKPNQVVTRGQAAIMIGRALGLDGTRQNTVFSDVKKNNGASGYIQSAVEEGIIQGFEDGTFRPNQTVTRGQMAIFITRAFDLDRRTFITFGDVSGNLEPYVEKVFCARIANGYSDNTFKPNKGVTRGEFSAFMARALEPSFKVPVSKLHKDIISGEGLGSIFMSIEDEGYGYEIVQTKNGKGYSVFTLESGARVIIKYDDMGFLSIKVELSKNGTITYDDISEVFEVFIRSIDAARFINFNEDMDDINQYLANGNIPFKYKGLIFDIEANNNNGTEYISISAAYDD